MTYQIIPGEALCYLKEGNRVNDVPIACEDFVNKYDHAPRAGRTVFLRGHESGRNSAQARGPGKI